MSCVFGSRPRLAAVLLAGALLCTGGASAQEVTAYESFEGGTPPNWVVGRTGALSASGLHYKHGVQSLRWDYVGGESLEVSDVGLGDITRTGGYGGSYSKATFGVWVYCEEPVEGSLRWEFRSGERPDAWFDFPLNFTGWRRAHLKESYQSEFQGRVTPTTDSIVITAPADVASGTVFIDLVVYNGVLDYRLQHVPSPDVWAPMIPDPEVFPIPETVSAEENEGVEYLEERMTPAAGEGLSTQAMGSLGEQVAALGIVRDEDGIRGLPLVHARWMEFYRGIEGITSASHVARLMLEVARAYHTADGNAEQREQLADWYALMAEHVRDQGMQPGAGFTWGGYDGRELAEANFLMRRSLRERGLLDWAAAYLEASYGTNHIFSTEGSSPSMDYFYLNTRMLLYGALMQVERAAQVRHLHALGRRLSADILYQGPPRANGFKPDGSAFHHDFHYFAYAEGAVRILAGVVEPLSHTLYRVSPEAMARLKQVALAMRFYCNQTDLPLPLCGRHPFSLEFTPVTLSTLARCGSPDGSQALDPELAAAYLRLVPEAADDEPFAVSGIAPEVIQGSMAMNYAGLLAHRRDNWLALAKGYGRYVRFGEIYADNNRFGRYLSNGYLDILGGGDPVSREGSGAVQDGWDWNRLDGTTVVYLPLEKLRAVSRGTEGIGSEERFVGGLSHRGWNGAFVMQIHGHEKHEPTFRGKKSYFFFDDRIICLGSDITNENAEFATHTNLFQKHLPDPNAGATIVEGEAISGLDTRRRLPDSRAAWMIDPQGTGYWLPAGQEVWIARMRQHSRNQADTTDTEGDFATGWIEHGTAPEAGWYEYAVTVRTTPERMEEFAEAMADGPQRPYDVLQRDGRAHIVFDRQTGTWGAVLFEGQRVEPEIPLAEVDRACLVMIEQKAGGGLHLSVADPDLNLEEYVSVPRALRISLRGGWDLAAGEDVRVIDRSTEATVIEVTCRDGRSYDLPLRPMG